MALWHDDIELTPGDDWNIPGILEKEDGSILNLTGAAFEWTAVDSEGVYCPFVESATISVVDATQGSINITVPRNITEGIEPDRIMDMLRVIKDGEADTFWRGHLLVNFDPFTIIPIL